MLDFTKGSDTLSNLEKQFLRDRLRGKGYSFFAGATPENGYVPTVPYQLTVSSNPYSFETENWAAAKPCRNLIKEHKRIIFDKKKYCLAKRKVVIAGNYYKK